LAAVKKYGSAIRYLQNPSEQLQLAAVKQNGFVIKYIQNPSEKVQIAAVQQDGLAIRFIQNPSERVLDYERNQRKLRENITRIKTLLS
jgi:DNA-dependent RNA polymerase auxiliary subunit epsilon